MNHQNDGFTDKPAFRTAYLIAGYLRQTLTKEEHDELDAWVEESDSNMKLFEELTEPNNTEASLAWMDSLDSESKLTMVKQDLHFTDVPGKRSRKTIWGYSIAASVLVVIAIGFLLTRAPKEKKGDVLVQEILPAANRTVLYLSDGSAVDLSQANNGVLTGEKKAILNKKDGTIEYAAGAAPSNAYNTLTTSIGGTYKIVLPDGSHVWINAKSSLKYPTAFPESERAVELDGEAYFEVAKDQAKPFKVKLKNGEQVKVLGTHFNVQSYSDEPLKEASLFEGKIMVSNGAKELELVPGQMATFTPRGMDMHQMPKHETLPAWKEDNFAFHDADLKSIMRQVGRWYNVEVSYDVNITNQFNAIISRKEPLSKLLHLLQATGKVHFKTEKNTIHVIR